MRKKFVTFLWGSGRETIFRTAYKDDPAVDPRGPSARAETRPARVARANPSDHNFPARDGVPFAGATNGSIFSSEMEC